MKKLQSDFTTQVQSKRLIELGVPVWTANCYFRIDLYSSKIEMCFTKEDSLIYDYIPCWSVGRLMNIFDICCAISDYNDWFNTQCVPNEYVAYIIGCYERAIDSKMLDFSKLEEYESK